MTTENKETRFDKREIRPMIVFVPGKQDTTESRLSNVREQMTFTRAKKTVRRTGWYFTEPYAPCGSLLQSSPFSQQAESGLNDIKSQIKSVFGA